MNTSIELLKKGLDDEQLNDIKQREYKKIFDFLSSSEPTFTVQKMHPYDLYALLYEDSEHEMIFFDDNFSVFFLLDGVPTFLTCHTPAKTQLFK